MCIEPLVRNTGGNTESHKLVNETAMDSRTGEKAPGAGAQLAAPPHGPGVDEPGVAPDAQGWGAGY